MARKPDMSRNQDLAGQTVSKGGFNISYDENGYATKATNYQSDHFKGTDKSFAAPSADSVLGGSPDRGSYGGSVYDQQYMSDRELASIAEIRAAAEAGSTSWDDAHAYAESIRGKYGYSGDTDGSKYIPLDTEKWDDGGGGGAFSYESAPRYTNKYKGKIDALTEAILGREAFSYDPEKDPTYQQYKESYTREGKRAMQDTVGQVSARTGGLASSYAGVAGQQTYDNYMAELSDKIPELRQLAYSMYQDEGDSQRANLEMLMALEQGDYNKYLTLLGQYNTDRNFDYGVHRDEIADDRWQTEWDYGVGRDQIADDRYEDETAYDREQDAWEKANYTSEKEYNQALQKAQTLAAAGDFSGYKALGYTDAEIAGLKTAYSKAQATASSGGRGSGSSGGKSSGSGGKPSNSNIYQALKDGGATDYGTAYAMLLSSGYGVTAAKELATYYADTWLGSQGGDSGDDQDYTIENRHGDSWIYIPGHGRFSYQEVYNYVESGKVKETIKDDGTIRYTWVNNKK